MAPMAATERERGEFICHKKNNMTCTSTSTVQQKRWPNVYCVAELQLFRIFFQTPGKCGFPEYIQIGWMGEN